MKIDNNLKIDKIKQGEIMNQIKTIDLSKILKNCSNEWVALSSTQEKVVGRGERPRQAYEQAVLKGEKDPVLVRAPKDFGTYIL